MAEGAKDVLAINKAIADLGTEVGIVEQQKLKLYRTITNAPFIKQTIQLSNFLKRIQGVQQKQTKMLPKPKKTQMNNEDNQPHC